MIVIMFLKMSHHPPFFESVIHTPSAFAIGAGGFTMPDTPAPASSMLLAHRKRHVWYAVVTYMENAIKRTIITAAINIAKIAPVALLMMPNIENPRTIE